MWCQRQHLSVVLPLRSPTSSFVYGGYLCKKVEITSCWWPEVTWGDLQCPLKKKATEIMIRRDEISHNTSVIPSACVEQWSISSYPLYLCSRWAVTELLCLDSIWPPETGAGRCGGADYSCIVSVGERRLCCSSPCWFERALTNKSSLQSSSL